MTRNSTRTAEIHFADGLSIRRKYRNSLGGFAAMMDRLAAEFDGKVQPLDQTGDRWTVAGREFTLEVV